MDYNPPYYSVHEDSPGQNTGVGCHALLLGIFPIQGSNPGLPHCRQILYHLSHQGSPVIHEGKNLFQPFSMNCDLYIGSFSLQKEAFSSLLIRNATIHTTADYRKHLTFAMITILYLPSSPLKCQKN